MSTMEFWAEVVTHDEPLNVVIEEGMVLHLSLACISEPKKDVGNETVYVTMTGDQGKHVLATLTTQKLPQQSFDLAFDKTFQLSHNWKNGSVNFIGYKAEHPAYGTDMSDSDEYDCDEDIPLSMANLVKSDKKVKKEEAVDTVNATSSKGKESKQKVKNVDLKEKSKKNDESSDEDSMSEDSDDSDSDSERHDMADFDDTNDELDDSDDEETPKKVESSKKQPAKPVESDDESDDSDEETPKKVASNKKRPAETSAVKTPRADKKVKGTPQKKDDEKNSVVHVATPFPGKKAGKTPATQQTPKSGGSHSCNSCKKTFGSEKALESHSKAKHDGGK